MLLCSKRQSHSLWNIYHELFITNSSHIRLMASIVDSLPTTIAHSSDASLVVDKYPMVRSLHSLRILLLEGRISLGHNDRFSKMKIPVHLNIVNRPFIQIFISKNLWDSGLSKSSTARDKHIPFRNFDLNISRKYCHKYLVIGACKADTSALKRLHAPETKNGPLVLSNTSCAQTIICNLLIFFSFAYLHSSKLCKYSIFENFLQKCLRNNKR